MNYSETMLRREIEKLPDGTYRAEGFVDGFENDPDLSKRDLKIAVSL
jgi:N-methylhydantoinase B